LSEVWGNGDAITPIMAIGIRPMNHYSLSSDSLDKQSNEEHQLCKLYATYMRDVIDGIREAIEKPYLCGQVYELGGAKPVTMDTANLLHDQNKVFAINDFLISIICFDKLVYFRADGIISKWEFGIY
jgi:hypothetical protein